MTSRKTPPLRTLKPPTPPPSKVRARGEEGSPEENYLTRGELKCLKVFAALLQSLGRSPTVREVSTELGLSENGAQKHVVSLQEKGYLEPELQLTVVGRKLTALGKKWAALP